MVRSKEEINSFKLQWYHKNKERLGERLRARAREYYHKNKDLCQIKIKIWREKNRARLLAYSAEQYRANRSKKIAYSRLYYSKNKEKINHLHREWLKENAEHIRRYGKEYRASNRSVVNTRKRGWASKNPDKIRLMGKKQYEKNKDKYKERSRAYYLANREECLARNKKWRQSDVGRSAFKVKKHNRSKRIRETGKISTKDWLVIRNTSPMCLMCGKFVECEKLTLDHIIPLSKGGTHTIENIQPLCFSCNSRKHARVRDNNESSQKRI